MMLSQKEFLAATAQMLGLDEEILDDYSLACGPQALAPTILALRELRHRAQKLEAFLEVRYGQERSATMYVAPDGKRYVFRSSRERELTDPDGLWRELAKLPMDGYQATLLIRAFEREPAKTKVNHGYLNQIADRSKAAREVIRSYRGWKNGIPHLELLDEPTVS